MSTFLQGKALSEKIKEVCAGDDVRCAVAFLGQSIGKLLFPNGLENVQIMCDISMGCTTKLALQEFGAPRSAKASANDKLKVCDGLHGKVYLSSSGAVIGSPNMSTRGLGRTLEGDWNLETGVFCPADSDACIQARTWFDERFEASSPVSWMDVCRAADAVRDAGRPPNADELRNLSLLERVERFPERFEDVTFLITEVDLPKATEIKLLKEESYGANEGIEVIIWDNHHKRVEATTYALGCHLLDNGKWQIDGYIKSHASAKDELLMFGINKWTVFKKHIGQANLRRKVHERDLAVLSRLRLLDKVTYTAGEMAAAIKRSKPS